MKTLIIHDSKGNIFTKISGDYISPDGNLGFLELEVPQGKMISKVDTTVIPNVPIYEDIPKTDLQLAEERLLAVEVSNAEMMNIIATMSKTT